MKNVAAGTLGTVIGGLAVAHLVAKERPLFGVLNVERNLTMARIPIALSLLWAGFMAEDEESAGRSLTSVGLSYLGMGGGALWDRRLGGMLKNDFTKADIAFHLATGVMALAIGMWPHKKKQPIQE